MLLLEESGVNVNTKDNHGRTPLLLAARSGHGEVVKLLLIQRDIEENSKDNNGRTPLYITA